VFHSLHCLNEIRIEMSKSLYPDVPVKQHGSIDLNALYPGWNQVHMEHCMDRLRQSLMCHGDLAPSPMYSYDGFPFLLGQSGEHTCRKFEKIRSWMDNRGKDVKPLD
jgi:hypothetical protein